MRNTVQTYTQTHTAALSTPSLTGSVHRVLLGLQYMGSSRNSSSGVRSPYHAWGLAACTQSKRGCAKWMKCFISLAGQREVCICCVLASLRTGPIPNLRAEGHLSQPSACQPASL